MKQKGSIRCLCAIVWVPLLMIGLFSEAGAAVPTASVQANHAYVPYEWCSEPADEVTIRRRLDTLEEYGITYLFCDIGLYQMVSPTEIDNTICCDALGAWIKLGHERGMRVLACINYAMNDYIHGMKEGAQTYHTWISAEIAGLCGDVTNSGVEYDGETYAVDGIHMDIEPFRRPFQTELLHLMQTVRGAIGAQKQLSLFAPAANGLWSDEYATQMIELTDMVCPGVYDTNGPSSWGGVTDGVTQTKEEYIRLVRDTCKWYAEKIAGSKNPDCRLSVTLPVYPDKGYASPGEGFPEEESGYIWYHLNTHPLTGETLETLENGLAGIRRAQESGVKVDGAGVFYWPSFVSGAKGNGYDFQAAQQAWKENWLLCEAVRLPGDVNGDGQTSVADYGLVLAHVRGVVTLEGPAFICADVNGDDAVTVADYGLVLAHVRGIRPLYTISSSEKPTTM